ncbi:MAG: hypothetical protein A2Y74_02455 [Actinobacteria bacterium RBG_13_63_9]|nr:MAG: hypothetical protein A2Y74_02455 [Actinobacteria bacterium RBG_13_63_9]
MRPLRLVDAAQSPLAQELELLQQLQATTAGGTERLRLTISGRRLFLDGFAESVDHKFRLEDACKTLAPQSILVNRLRVAASEGPRVS